MSAAIIPLPGAAVAPVLGSRLSRGRPPRNVVGIGPDSVARARRQSRLAKADGLAEVARRLRNGVSGIREQEAWALGHAAVLEAQVRALRGGA